MLLMDIRLTGQKMEARTIKTVQHVADVSLLIPFQNLDGYLEVVTIIKNAMCLVVANGQHITHQANLVGSQTVQMFAINPATLVG